MYAKRYGVGLQQTLFGSNIMPDQELMIWTAGVTQWIEWYDYVRESAANYDAHCPESIKDSPQEFNSWISAQIQKEKTKMNKPYGRH